MKLTIIKTILISFVLINLISCQSNNGWTPLFNGENLDGWHVYGGGEFNGWDVQEGILLFDPSQRTEAKSSNLVTDKEYTNFELSFDWMIAEQGNSGLFWSIIEKEEFEHPYLTGPEIQILDDGWTAYIEERGDICRAGSLYGMKPPNAYKSNPSGEWNRYLLHVDHVKNEGFLEFNEEIVVQFPVHGPEWEKLIQESRFKKWKDFGSVRTGRIGLQDYGGKVAFRNIKIRELPNE